MSAFALLLKTDQIHSQKSNLWCCNREDNLCAGLRFLPLILHFPHEALNKQQLPARAHFPIHIFFRTENLITLSTPCRACCHVQDLHSTPCTFARVARNKARRGEKNRMSRSFPMKRERTEFCLCFFRVSCCSFYADFAVFPSVPGLCVKRSGNTDIPGCVGWSVSLSRQICFPSNFLQHNFVAEL